MAFATLAFSKPSLIVKINKECAQKKLIRTELSILMVEIIFAKTPIL